MRKRLLFFFADYDLISLITHVQLFGSSGTFEHSDKQADGNLQKKKVYSVAE